MFGYSWCVTSVLGSQVFGQASMESCVLSLYCLIKSKDISTPPSYCFMTDARCSENLNIYLLDSPSYLFPAWLTVQRTFLLLAIRQRPELPSERKRAGRIFWREIWWEHITPWQAPGTAWLSSGHSSRSRGRSRGRGRCVPLGDMAPTEPQGPPGRPAGTGSRDSTSSNSSLFCEVTNLPWNCLIFGVPRGRQSFIPALLTSGLN